VPDRLLNGLTASLPSPVTLEPFNLADSYNDCKFTTEGNQDGSIECKDQDPIGCTAQQLDGEILTCVVTFWNCNF
jgi:hypothetical protein